MRDPHTFWHGRRVFVTGCSGFLGTAVVRDLLARGAAVTGLVRDRPTESDFFRSKLFEGIAVVRGRAEDLGRLTTQLAVRDTQAVVHCAPLPNMAIEAVRRAAPACPVVVPIAWSDGAAEADVRTLAVRTGVRVGVARLHDLLGGTRRHPDGWPARLLAAAAAGQPLPRPTDTEAAVRFGTVRAAADHCLAVAAAVAELRDGDALAAPLPATYTGAEVFAAVKQWVEAPAVRLFEPAAVPPPLADAVRDAIDRSRRVLGPSPLEAARPAA